MTTGEKLRQARKKKGLSQDELAAMVNIDRLALGRIERGVVSLNIDTAVILADTLGITLDYLARATDAGPQIEGAISEQYVHQLNILEKLSPADVPHVLAVLDAFVTKAQLQSIIK
jgi:transcriptional regulator with XRE-family HTH domain